MKVLIATIIFMTSLVAAADAPRVLSYSQWKAQQVADAQNKVARLSNKLTLIKSDQTQKLPSKGLEQELQAASQSLEIVKEYTIDHYVATYLTQYSDSREALLELSQSTSKEEMADLLTAILKVRPSSLTANEKPSKLAF